MDTVKQHFRDERVVDAGEGLIVLSDPNDPNVEGIVEQDGPSSPAHPAAVLAAQAAASVIRRPKSQGCSRRFHTTQKPS